MKHALRLLRIWGIAILLGILPAIYWGARPGAPLWYAALRGAVDAAMLGLTGVAAGALVLLAGRARSDNGMRPAVMVGATVVLVLWAMLTYVRARYG